MDRVVAKTTRRHGYVVLDCHWSDMEEWGLHISQHKMPDLNSMAFWKDLAVRFGNNPAVLFDLYNEPRDVTWEIWRNGGSVTEKDDAGVELTYKTPGMQKLVKAIRAAGARNVIVAGGLDWDYDLAGIMKGYALDGMGGRGTIYATHIYPWKGMSTNNWDPYVTVAADKYPILVGEVGCEPDPKQEDPLTWAPKILAYIDRHQMNWTARCFHPSASPRLLADWTYKPTSYWGEFVKKQLEKGALGD